MCGSSTLCIWDEIAATAPLLILSPNPFFLPQRKMRSQTSVELTLIQRKLFFL